MPAPDDEYRDDGDSTAGAKDWETITPHDTNYLTFLPKAITVGSQGGIVRCESEDGNTSDFYLNSGQVLPIRPVRIHATATTATPIMGLK